jgi:hypothetical protein
VVAGLEGSARAVGDADAAVDVGEMHCDGALGDADRAPDLLVGKSLAGQAQDLPFPLAELLGGGGAGGYWSATPMQASPARISNAAIRSPPRNGAASSTF